MFIILLLLFTSILLLYKPYQYYKIRQLINKIPGPPGTMILGNIPDFYGTLEDIWKFGRNMQNKYYPIRKLWFLFKPVVIISHPDDMEKILNDTKHIEKGTAYKYINAWLGTGLLTSTGSKWHSRRKILTPAFHFNILQQFVDILVEEGDHMTKSLKNSEGPVTKNIVSFISEHTLNAICETAMGISLRNFDTSHNQQEYRQTVQKMGELIVYRMTRPWLTDRIFRFTSMGRMQAKYLNILHGFTEKVIAERKLYHERTNGQHLKGLENTTMSESKDAEISGIQKKRLAMLDLLIAKSRENHLNDSDIREEVDTFMFEGHDTTAMGVCFALLLLAEHKDVQKLVREEINSVSQETGGKFTMASLQKLPYLERCLKETMRLFPSVPSIARVTAYNVTLQSYMVPAKTDIGLNIYDLHRDANFWPNPEVFDPDRFLPDQIKNRHPYSYVPFSAGPRNCIGQRFAMLEMKAMIAPLVRNFYMEAIDYLKELRIQQNIVLRPVHSLHIKFIPIEHM